MKKEELNSRQREMLDNYYIYNYDEFVRLVQKYINDGYSLKEYKPTLEVIRNFYIGKTKKWKSKEDSLENLIEHI